MCVCARVCRVSASLQWTSLRLCLLLCAVILIHPQCVVRMKGCFGAVVSFNFLSRDEGEGLSQCVSLSAQKVGPRPEGTFVSTASPQADHSRAPVMTAGTTSDYPRPGGGLAASCQAACAPGSFESHSLPGPVMMETVPLSRVLLLGPASTRTAGSSRWTGLRLACSHSSCEDRSHSPQREGPLPRL